VKWFNDTNYLRQILTHVWHISSNPSSHCSIWYLQVWKYVGTIYRLVDTIILTVKYRLG